MRQTVPNGSQWWVMLIGGRLEGLPKAKSISAARLCIPVTNSHSKANVKVAAVALKAPVEKGKAVDANGLGRVLGTAIVGKQAAPAAARYYRVDVTRYIKDVAGGREKFLGLGVKVIPDRGVDDGWTVRIDVSKEKKTYLEIDVYTE